MPDVAAVAAPAASPAPTPGPGALPPASGAGSSPGVLGAAVEELLSGTGEPAQAPAPGAGGTPSGGTLDGALKYLRSQGLPDSHPAIQEVLALKTAEGRWRAQQAQQQSTAPTADDAAMQMAWNAEVRATALSDEDARARAIELGLSSEDAQDFIEQANAYRAARRPQGGQPAASQPSAPTPLTVESLFDVASGAYRETMTPIWQASAAMQAADARAAQAQAILADSSATADERARAQETLKEAMRDHRAAKMFEHQAQAANLMKLVMATIKQELARELAPIIEFREKVQPTFDEAERMSAAEAEHAERVSRGMNEIANTLTPDGHSYYGPHGLGLIEADENGQLRRGPEGYVYTDRGKRLLPEIIATMKTHGLAWSIDNFNLAIEVALSRTSDGGSVAPQPGAGQAGGVSLSQLAAQAGSAHVSPGATQGGQLASVQTPY